MTAPRRRAMTPLAWGGVIASVVVLIAAGVVWLGAINDHDGDPLLDTPGAVLVALIGAFGLVASTLGPQLLQILRHVENDHKDAKGNPLGLRDDMDGKHTALSGDIRRLTNIALTTQRDVAWLMRRQVETDDRLDAVESTQPKETT